MFDNESNNTWLDHANEHSCHVWSHLLQWFSRRRLKCLRTDHPLPEVFFENNTFLWNHFVNFNQALPKCSLGDPLPKLCSVWLWPYTGAWAIRHLICLVTLIMNIYGLRVGISTIKKFTSGRRCVMTLHWGLSYKAFNLPSHPDHEYIWFRSG
jgi:hypothetical protein